MVAAVASVLLGAVDTYIAALIGYIIDILIDSEASLLVAKHWALILAFSIFDCLHKYKSVIPGPCM